MRYIGDVHGKFKKYRELIRYMPASIQVGDMGIGFRHTNGELQAGPPWHAMVEGNHRFIRGNHDNPEICKEHSQYISDGTIEGDTMFIGGALSIDRAWRTEGYSYWSNEELSISELNSLVDKYIEVKPRIMITHECPEEVACALKNVTKLEMPSRTRQAFQAMFSAHSPELWIFGHWHQSFDHIYRGTRFKCLNELEIFDL